MTWGCFKINDQQCPQTTEGSALLQSGSRLKNYKIQVYDHSGLFEGVCSIDALSSTVADELHLVIFVLKCRYSFDENKDSEKFKSCIDKL